MVLEKVFTYGVLFMASLHPSKENKQMKESYLKVLRAHINKRTISIFQSNRILCCPDSCISWVLMVSWGTGWITFLVFLLLAVLVSKSNVTKVHFHYKQQTAVFFQKGL